MLNQNSLERENVECHETKYECDECDDDHDGDDKLASEPDVCTPSYHADCSSLTAATSTLSTPSLLHTCTLDPSKSISAAKTQDNDADLTVSNDVFETVDNSFNHMSNANIQNVNSGACSHADLLTSVSVPANLTSDLPDASSQDLSSTSDLSPTEGDFDDFDLLHLESMPETAEMVIEQMVNSIQEEGSGNKCKHGVDIPNHCWDCTESIEQEMRWMRDFHHNQNQQVHPDIINYDPPQDNLHSDTSSMISEDDYHDDSLPCLTISGNGESLMSNASLV